MNYLVWHDVDNYFLLRTVLFVTFKIIFPATSSIGDKVVYDWLIDWLIDCKVRTTKGLFCSKTSHKIKMLTSHTLYVIHTRDHLTIHISCHTLPAAYTSCHMHFLLHTLPVTCTVHSHCAPYNRKWSPLPASPAMQDSRPGGSMQRWGCWWWSRCLPTSSWSPELPPLRLTALVRLP